MIFKKLNRPELVVLYQVVRCSAFRRWGPTSVAEVAARLPNLDPQLVGEIVRDLEEDYLSVVGPVVGLKGHLKSKVENLSARELFTGLELSFGKSPSSGETFEAIFVSSCKGCRQPTKAGELLTHRQGFGIWHASCCPVEQDPREEAPEALVAPPPSEPNLDEFPLIFEHECPECKKVLPSGTSVKYHRNGLYHPECVKGEG